jgi:hydroxymethylbilane synthase
VGRTAATLDDLPPHAVVGTSSIRRVAQVMAVRPDLIVKPLRGNVDTRLRRLDTGDYDALILAAAGLERLGLKHRITDLLRPPAFWPAVAQGALAIQVRADDHRVREAVLPLDHPATHAAVIAERRMLADLAGGCLAPIGAWACLRNDAHLTLGGCVLSVDPETRCVHKIIAEATSSVPFEAPLEGPHSAELSPMKAVEAIGAFVATELLSKGAACMLDRMRAESA